jgi:hypothetical protein
MVDRLGHTEAGAACRRRSRPCLPRTGGAPRTGGRDTTSKVTQAAGTGARPAVHVRRAGPDLRRLRHRRRLVHDLVEEGEATGRRLGLESTGTSSRAPGAGGTDPPWTASAAAT